MSEAAGPLNEAVDTALLADAVLIAFLGGQHVYSGQGPSQDATVYDYVELGSDDSSPFLRFNGTAPGKPREGERLGLRIDCWSRITRADDSRIEGKARILALVGHIARVLNSVQLALPSYGLAITGRAELITTVKDPLGQHMHGWMRYEAMCTRMPG